MVKLTNVKKSYGGFKLDCSLSVKPGMITGLIGQNGAGKSTTFKALLDLISIDSGTVEIFGKDHRTLTPCDKEKIGVVLSDSGFSMYLNIKDVAAVLNSMYSCFRKDEFLEKCRRFELPPDKTLREFSTGMKAKLKLLVAMSHDAKLLILDEPTSGLDVVARNELLELLQDYMNENEDASVLISSHISGDLENYCDDIYMIDKGKIVLHEETDVLLSDYGLLKADEKQYATLDKSYILRQKKESYGFYLLTDQRKFYMENYPGMIVEKGNIDDVILMMVKGEAV